MKLSKAQVRALHVCEANRRVWFDWSLDAEDVRLSRLYNGIDHRTFAVLIWEGLLRRSPTWSALHHSRPLVPTEAGYAALAACPNPLT